MHGVNTERREKQWDCETDREFAVELAQADPRFEGILDNALFRALLFTNQNLEILNILHDPFSAPGSLLKAAKFEGGGGSASVIMSDVINAGCKAREMRRLGRWEMEAGFSYAFGCALNEIAAAAR